MTNSLTTPPPISYGLSRSVAERLSRYWWLVLLNGLALIVAGVLIFSIDWDRDSLAAFIGALFIFEGAVGAMSDGVDRTTRRTNVSPGSPRSPPASRSSCGPRPGSWPSRCSSARG